MANTNQPESADSMPCEIKKNQCDISTFAILNKAVFLFLSFLISDTFTVHWWDRNILSMPSR